MIKRIVDNFLFIHEQEGVFRIPRRKKSAKEKFVVAIVIDTALVMPPTTGVTYRLQYLSRELVRRGHRIVWILGNRNFVKKEDLSQLVQVGVRVHLLPPRLFYDHAYVAGILKRERVDLVQYEITQTFLDVGLRIRTITKLPAVLEMHDVEANLMQTLGKGKENVALMKFLQYIAGEYAEAIVCMTPSDFATLVDVVGVQREKVFLAPNGVREENFVSPGKEKKPANTLLFLGNLFYPPNQQGLRFIADTILPALPKKKNIVLKVIGMTPRALALKYRGRTDIVFLGEIRDEARFRSELAASTIGLCTVFSGSGMKVKILDYCAAGLPVISTSIGASGYEEMKNIIVKDTAAGVIRAINVLLNDPKKARQIGSQNKKDIRARYAWVSIAATAEQAMQLARSFDMRTSVPQEFRPFWLEEKRHASKVLSEHYIVHNNKIIKQHEH